MDGDGDLEKAFKTNTFLPSTIWPVLLGAFVDSADSLHDFVRKSYLVGGDEDCILEVSDFQ
jgi:hypothetical protein